MGSRPGRKTRKRGCRPRPRLPIVSEKIWTIDARDNVLLDVMSEVFDLSPAQLGRELWQARDLTASVLASKGVDYAKLRNALTPRRDRHEFAFVFDSASTGGQFNYALPAQERLLSLLPAKDFSCSLLSGDLIISNQERGFELLRQGLALHRQVRDLVDTSELFAIYVNNLTMDRASAIHNGLVDWDGYVGRILCTYSSRTKDWLSTTLGSAYVKVGKTFICDHEDDVSNDESYNLPGWPVEELGYRCISLQTMYYGMLLSYKIERRVMPGETDTKHALSAISISPKELDAFRVEVTDEKLAYIAAHGGGFNAAGLDSTDRTAVQEMIRERIRRNYIYELQLVEHEKGTTSKFNIMLEFPRTARPPVRMLATLEYIPDDEVLRLITLF